MRDILVSSKKFAKAIMYYVKKTKKIIRKFDLEVTRYINAISQLRLKVHNDSLTLKNYEIKREQFQRNRIFGTNASQFY